MLESVSFEKLNGLVTVFFSVAYQGALISGLDESDFTLRLWDPTDTDVSGGHPVTVTELGSSGRYYAQYTNDSVEEWFLEIVHATYFPLGLDATALVYAAQHGDTNDSSAVLEVTVLVGNTPVTGLVTGDFTYELWNPSRADVNATVSTTIVELGNGKYRAKFSAATEQGDWFSAIKHAIYFPLGVTGVWRYIEPDIPDKPSITTATNDNTGTSSTLALEAGDPSDELYVYYRTVPAGAWTLFGSSRTGSGDLQITGQTNNTMYENICIASRSGSPTENPSLPSEPKRVFVTDSATALTPIRQALYDWVADQLPWTVVWKMPNAPQPPLPFIAIRMRPTGPIGEDSHSELSDSGVETIIGDREFMFEVDFLGAVSPTGEDPTWSYAEQVSSSLQKPSVVSTLSAAGIAPVEPLPIQDLTAIASVLFQARAMLEVRFRIAWITTDTVNWVETSDAPSGTVIP